MIWLMNLYELINLLLVEVVCQQTRRLQEAKTELIQKKLEIMLMYRISPPIISIHQINIMDIIKSLIQQLIKLQK